MLKEKESKMSEEKKTFEEALTELENIVRNLESGRVQLEEAVNAYEKGMALKKMCEDRLAEAKGRIDKLVINHQNEITGKEPLDVESC